MAIFPILQIGVFLTQMSKKERVRRTRPSIILRSSFEKRGPFNRMSLFHPATGISILRLEPSVVGDDGVADGVGVLLPAEENHLP